MKILTPLFALFTIAIIVSCNSEKEPESYCDDPCLKDTLRFALNHPLRPYVYISADNCTPDTLIWSHSALANNRKMGLTDLLGRSVTINAKKIACFISDTSYAWLQFIDCATGRGFLLKLPFDKKQSIIKYTSGFTNFVPGYHVEDGLIAYSDNNFVYAENVRTGKIEKLLLSDKTLKIDFNKMRETFDSVHVTSSQIYVQLKGGEPMTKKISLE